jgi:hypothetical protein
MTMALGDVVGIRGLTDTSAAKEYSSPWSRSSAIILD